MRYVHIMLNFQIVIKAECRLTYCTKNSRDDEQKFATRFIDQYHWNLNAHNLNDGNNNGWDIWWKCCASLLKYQWCIAQQRITSGKNLFKKFIESLKFLILTISIPKVINAIPMIIDFTAALVTTKIKVISRPFCAKKCSQKSFKVILEFSLSFDSSDVVLISDSSLSYSNFNCSLHSPSL